MVSKRRRLMALLLAVVTLLSVVTVGTLSISAAAGDTVYCEDAANWGTVYCYMWGDGSDNGSWPGVKMTQGEGSLWSYSVTGNWTKIIFNNGSDQKKTGDLDYPGNGKIYNNSTGEWTTNGDAPINTTPVTTAVTTVPSGGDSPVVGGKNLVYCRNSANWSKVNVYMWTDDAGNNASWPGVPATEIGDGVWMYEASRKFDNVIFNDGSTQTGNLTYQGSDYIYDNSTGTWELYDTSKLHIKSFTSDVASPQYTGVKINLSVTAGGGEGELSYQFSVGNTVISAFSSNSSVAWTPTSEGSYTVTVEVKDTANQSVSKAMTYEIKDISKEVKPVIQSVEITPSNFGGNEVKKGTESTVSVTAGGGNTGTKLLFYKYTITDPSGKTANVPYYTLKNEYKFTPVALGNYSITATVEGSDNSFTARTVEYECVDEFSKPGDLSLSISAKEAGDSKYTVTANAAGGAAPYTYQFAVNGTVVQDYSNKATYTLEAADEGNYTVAVTVKDSEGKTVTKSTSIQVGGSELPTPPATEVLKATLDVEDKGDGIYKFTANATGGDGSYSYEYTANGVVISDYSDKNIVTLDLSSDGTYNIKVNVKDGEGATASAEKIIIVSGGDVDITEPSTPPETDPTTPDPTGSSTANTTPSSTQPVGDYLKGDADCNGKVNVKDATMIQKHIAMITQMTEQGIINGEVDGNGKLNVKDATMIQKYIANIIKW